MLNAFLHGIVQDWLKPGGKLFITDYCCTEEPWSDIYVKQRGYILLSPKEYGKVSGLLRIHKGTHKRLKIRLCFKSPILSTITRSDTP